MITISDLKDLTATRAANPHDFIAVQRDPADAKLVYAPGNVTRPQVLPPTPLLPRYK